MINLKQFCLSTVLISGLAGLAIADTQVNVVGLFNGKALVTINGSTPQTLSVGQTKNGVKLIAADSQQATLLIEGKTKVLGMGQGVSTGGAGESTQSQPVNLYADSAGHFFGNATVNGAGLRYVVDTGATTVAMNSTDAKRANIDYLKGEKSVASTANGQVVAYRVTLNTLKIGSITMNNVEAAVIEGGFPEVVLLGMTALNRLDMKRDGKTMTLTKKY